MTTETTWADEQPWGVDVFVTIECDCGKTSGHSADWDKSKGDECGVPWKCPACAVSGVEPVNVPAALERGRARVKTGSIIEGV